MRSALRQPLDLLSEGIAESSAAALYTFHRVPSRPRRTKGIALSRAEVSVNVFFDRALLMLLAGFLQTIGYVNGWFWGHAKIAAASF
jgi:hypothetical protein